MRIYGITLNDKVDLDLLFKEKNKAENCMKFEVFKNKASIVEFDLVKVKK